MSQPINDRAELVDAIDLIIQRCAQGEIPMREVASVLTNFAVEMLKIDPEDAESPLHAIGWLLTEIGSHLDPMIDHKLYLAEKVSKFLCGCGRPLGHVSEPDCCDCEEPVYDDAYRCIKHLPEELRG